VGSIRAIHFSVVSQSVVASSSGAIGFAGPQHGADNPCCLVGDGNRCPVETPPLPKVIDPLVLPVMLIRHCSHDGSGAVHQQAAKMPATVPRFEIPIITRLSPLECYRGTSPSHAAR